MPPYSLGDMTLSMMAPDGKTIYVGLVTAMLPEPPELKLLAAPPITFPAPCEWGKVVGVVGVSIDLGLCLFPKKRPRARLGEHVRDFARPRYLRKLVNAARYRCQYLNRSLKR